jgi:carbon-monoxide dehydrogenase medium subunit
MLRKLGEFEYSQPTMLQEAISLLEKYGEEAKILSGGTDLFVAMKEQRLSPKYLVDIKNIPDLEYIRYDEKEGLRIGALTTIRQIETSLLIRERFLPLAQAAKVLGSVQVRNRATIGGNLCNAAPSAETAPTLLVLNTNVKVAGSKGERTLPLEQFFLGPGLTVLQNEILTEIRVPSLSTNIRGVYLKIGRRRAVDLALVGVAVAVAMDGNKWKDVRIALGAVAPTPIRARRAEKLLEGKRTDAALMQEAGQIASEEASPISDVRASAWYRKELVKVLVQRALEQIDKPEMGGGR